MSPLISDFSLLTVDLPFDFNTFDLTADIDVEFPSIDLSRGGVPLHRSVGAGTAESESAESRSGAAGRGLLVAPFPELAIELPKLPGLDLSLPDLNLGLPHFSLPDLAVQFLRSISTGRT